MKLTKHNELVFPLQLESEDLLCYRPFSHNSQWLEYFIIRANNENMKCQFIARDKLHVVDHKEEIALLKPNLFIVEVFYTYDATRRGLIKKVCGIQVASSNQAPSVYTAVLPMQVSKLLRFDSNTLYCKDYIYDRTSRKSL